MESSNNINATIQDPNPITIKRKDYRDGKQRISTKLDNNKFQVTISPFPGWNQGRDADTSSIEYEHILKDENGRLQRLQRILKDENGRNQRLKRFFIEERNPAMAGYDGYPATYSIDGVNASRDEYRQTNANMKDLMDPENFIKVVNNGIENSNKQNRERLLCINKAIQPLPIDMMNKVLQYAKPDAVENTQNRNNAINDAFVEKIQRKREQRPNACNKCAIF